MGIIGFTVITSAGNTVGTTWTAVMMIDTTIPVMIIATTTADK
jgi:hypothetical protein